MAPNLPKGSNPSSSTPDQTPPPFTKCTTSAPGSSSPWSPPTPLRIRPRSAISHFEEEALQADAARMLSEEKSLHEATAADLKAKGGSLEKELAALRKKRSAALEAENRELEPTKMKLEEEIRLCKSEHAMLEGWVLRLLDDNPHLRETEFSAGRKQTRSKGKEELGVTEGGFHGHRLLGFGVCIIIDNEKEEAFEMMKDSVFGYGLVQAEDKTDWLCTKSQRPARWFIRGPA